MRMEAVMKKLKEKAGTVAVVIVAVAILALAVVGVVKYFMTIHDLRELRRQVNNLSVKVERHSPTLIEQNHAVLGKLDNHDVGIEELRQRLDDQGYKLHDLKRITLEIQEQTYEGTATPSGEISKGTHAPPVKFEWDDPVTLGWLVCPSGDYGVTVKPFGVDLEAVETESGELLVSSDNPLIHVTGITWKRRPVERGFWDKFGFGASIGVTTSPAFAGKVGGSWNKWTLEASGDTDKDLGLWVGKRWGF